MKEAFTILITLFSINTFAQQTGQVGKGSLGIGLHWACPQSELQYIDYDDGLGIHFSYLSRKMPYKSPVNFQVGARMDFAKLGTRDFENIVVVDDGNTLPGGATVTATNRMYGLLGMARLNYVPEGSRVTPYIDFLAGHRNYTTFQTLALNEPTQNLEYEAIDITNRIVHTKRFHYGGSVGVNYQVSDGFSLESSVTYTFGETGIALPLQDIVRVEGSNEISYDNYQNVKTDLLLINVGFRIHLFKTYTYQNQANNRSRTEPTSPQNTRYKDMAPTSTTNGKSNNGTNTQTEGGIKGTPGRTSTPSTPTPIKKKVPTIKSDGPKRDTNAGG